MKQDIRYNPLYSLTEVSRYARIQPATLRLWTKKNSIVMLPINEGLAPLSFINLIESHVLVALRRTHQVPMQRIRRAVDWLQEQYNTKHPLAELDLETDGHDVFIRELGLPINASKHGQSAFAEILARYLKRIDRDKNNIPIRFYPFPYDASPKTIVMDPSVAYGRPVIKGTRISTLMVFDRYSGGESLNDIADDYELTIPYVEEALRCEIERRAA
ncbi:MAG: DUF433 domain-containing protein [Deltaproteobacteria bacterium]|nr:DUF433 domain-containing protein [Deltaproteobacteria bacterium]